jgi:ATP-dependent DNA ligase
MERFHSKTAAGTFSCVRYPLFNGQSLLSVPLEKRLEMLQEIVRPSDSISVAKTYDNGAALFEGGKAQGLEGIVTKTKNSRYRESVKYIV